jgi:hypothetical protein
MIGKSCFTAFMAVMAFGIDNESQKFALVTGILVGIWPFIQTLLFFQYPDSFEKHEKFVPTF